jgi:2-hydroxychromene-2-carboxylate isomerase
MALLDDPAHIQQIVSQAGIDAAAVDAVMKDPATAKAVEAQMDEINETGFLGTPTVFIKDAFFVGPKPYRVYAIALKGLLYWMK